MNDRSAAHGLKSVWPVEENKTESSKSDRDDWIEGDRDGEAVVGKSIVVGAALGGVDE